MSDSNPPTAELLEGTRFAFAPVPLIRARSDGWSREQQERFICALATMGSVGAALRAVGMSRASAYRLRERAGAESFAKAWDVALQSGRSRQFDIAMERALEGVTTVTLRKSGAVAITTRPDMAIMAAVLGNDPFGRGAGLDAE